MAESMDPKTLAESCTATARAARDALRWVSDPRNAAKVSQERAATESKLRRVAAESGRLARSALRPTCVGVFGPSQAGKSYLISILARQGTAPLVATFAGDRPEVDFVRDINPIGGDESTGVVTRFTTRTQPSPAGYPVCLRLLTQTDIVKVLVNSFFQDGDQEYETALDAAAIESVVAGLEARAGPAALDGLSDADLWGVADYVQRHSGGAASAAALEAFWGRIAVIAPRLPLAERAALLSLLWGRHDTYTAIFLRLVAALASLGFPEDAFCAVAALVPSKDSVINVNALDGIHDSGAVTLDVATADGRAVALPRPVVTALIAELRIVCRDRPLPFFDHTDLLDFPGYRTRFKRDLKRYFRDAADTASKDVFLRGKVDYLFQRYTGELELTAMVLCIPDSVMEVATLPKAIETWVAATHGATPERRQGRPNLLFVALTKFDRTLERKAGGEDGNLPEKFDIRFNASLSPFAKIEPSWVRQWTLGRPFQNLFLIRNPNVRFMGVIDYDGARETGIVPAEVPRLAALRSAFVALPAARLHFPDPGEAWDALMSLDDGGAGRLARALERVCVPELKLGQVAARLGEIRRDVVAALSRYHVSDDVEARRAERLAVVEEVIFPDLEDCAMRGTFGRALRGLMVDASDLHAALVETLNRPAAEAEDAPAVEPPQRRSIFTSKSSPAAPVPAAPVARPDRWSRLAGAALSCWASVLYARIEDPIFGRRVGLGPSSLREIVAEIGAAARRAALGERIAAELKVRSAPAEQNEAIARRAALVAERRVNRFVSELDFDRVAPAAQLERFRGDLDAPVFAQREVAYDTSGIGDERPDFAVDFMEQWGRAFRTAVSQNALSKTGTLEDAQQNARLGEILHHLAA